jgi:hypothetical protein
MRYGCGRDQTELATDCGVVNVASRLQEATYETGDNMLVAATVDNPTARCRPVARRYCRSSRSGKLQIAGVIAEPGKRAYHTDGDGSRKSEQAAQGMADDDYAVAVTDATAVAIDGACGEV